MAITPVPPRTKRPGLTKFNYKVNRELALVMLLQGKTQQEVADYFKVDRSAISHLFRRESEFIEGYKAFKADTATYYESKEYMIAKSLTEEDIKKMSGYQKVGSMGLLRDKVRTERNQATLITDDMSSIIDRVEQRYIDITPDQDNSNNNQ